MDDNKLNNICVIVVIVFEVLMILFSKSLKLLKVIGAITAFLVIYLNKKRSNEMKYRQAAVKLQNRRYMMAVEAMDGSIWEWDEDSRKVYISNKIVNLLGIDDNYIYIDDWYSYVIEEDRWKVKKRLTNIYLNRKEVDISLKYRVKDVEGNTRHIQHEGKGQIKGDRFYLTGVVRDVTEKKRQDILLKEHLEKYKRVVEGSKDIVFCWKFSKGIVIFDNKIKRYIDAEEENGEVTLIHNEWVNMIYFEDRELHRNTTNNILLDSDDGFYEIEYRITTKDNKIRWISSKGKKVNMGNGEVYIYGLLSDITDRKQNEMEIHFMSYYDEVTGIPNRRTFTAELEKAIKKCDEEGKKLALVFIDLDNFKIINDTYGHHMGDDVLRAVCESFYDILGKKHLLARFGGDEFVIIIEDIDSEQEIKIILDRIINKLKTPLKVKDKDIYCTFSVGVSIYPDYSDTINSLLKHADMAMYRAKANGKNRYEFFHKSILSAMNRDFEIEKALRRAIKDEEIYLNYQPKVLMSDRSISGFEVLVRWNSGEIGFVPPDEFIPVAENTGMIIDIGKYIIDKSFSKCRELSLKTRKKFNFAINISDVQLRDENFVMFIKEQLLKHEIDPEYIEFEITESVIMKSVSRNIDTLMQLKELGISIALDDFGTGYSSLNYLRRLPIDVVKIDKSFIDGIGIDEKGRFIANSIINLSHNLGLMVVAEGVESKEQLDYLSNISCDIVQGYYFSKPQEYCKAKDMILSE